MTQMIKEVLTQQTNDGAELFSIRQKHQSLIDSTGPADPDSAMESGRSHGELSGLLDNQTSQVKVHGMQGMLDYGAQ